MFTLTAALPPAGTVTLGVLKVAVSDPVRYAKLNGYTAPDAVDGPVPIVVTSERSYVTGTVPPFVTVSWELPPLPSPREILAGVTHPGAGSAGGAGPGGGGWGAAGVGPGGAGGGGGAPGGFRARGWLL